MAGVGSEMTVASPGIRCRITSSLSSLGLSRPVSSYEGNLARIAFCLTDYVTRVISSRGSVHAHLSTITLRGPAW